MQQATGSALEKSPWLDDLGASLAALGLRVKTVAGDGNCLFCALADQLQVL